MKVRIAKDLYAEIQARAELLGCDVSEVSRRALRFARRCGVADLLARETATRDGSTVATLDVPQETWPPVPGIGAARIRWALETTRHAACLAEPETEPGQVVVVPHDDE